MKVGGELFRVSGFFFLPILTLALPSYAQGLCYPLNSGVYRFFSGTIKHI
jgi:hypothetical protein